jgi:LysR family nitrogen assimilation transcriptional regulator
MNVMRLSLRQLDYFVAIIDAGSMSRAAGALHVTPTSLSLQMKQLEDMLGARLLMRHSRGVEPTESGRVFYARALAILDLVRSTEREFLDGALRPVRTLHLGVTPAVSRTVGIAAVTGADRFDGIRLALSEGWTGEMVPRLADGSLDFIIAYDLVPLDDIEVIDFYDEEFVFICRPGRFPEGQPVDLAQVIASELVFYGKSSVSWRAMLDAATAHGLALKPGLEVQSIEVWRGLLTRGLGTAVAPLAAVETEIRHGELAVHRIAGAPIVRRIGLAARREILNYGRGTGFVDFLSDLIGQSQPTFSVRVPRLGPRARPPTVPSHRRA